MTAFEAYHGWLKEIIEKLVPDPTHAPSCAAHVNAPCDCGMFPSTLEQRLAIGLIQARALELRSVATKMQLRGLDRKSPQGAWLFQQLWDRSHELEQIGLSLCAAYPPAEEAGPRLVQ